MLLAGCYERFLFGYRLAPGEEQPQLERAFTHAAHKGVVKCAAAAGPYAATGGADDLVHLYDLKNDKDLGFLMSPGEGAVTALVFFTPPAAYAPSHLLTGAADGSLTVWSAGGGWEAMKSLRGHRKEVSAIAVHPSGLLALSVARDASLRMWDLVKGRCTYTVRLEAEAEAVAFCEEDGGARYALLAGQRVSVHSVAGGDHSGVLAALAHPRRALCMAWAPGGRLLTGSEDGSLRLWDAEAGTELLCINRAHASRIRALALVPSGSSTAAAAAAAGGGEEALLVATASTDGSLKLWDLSKAAAAAPGASGGACLAEAQTRARLTCLAAADSPAVMRQRTAAAAAARQQAAQAAAAQQQQQQQQGQGQAAAAAGKKRKAVAAGDAAQAAAARPAKKAGKGPQPKQQQQQQQAGGKPSSKPGSKPGKPEKGGKGGGKPGGKGGPAAAAAAAAADDGVRVHDGVVEFLDSPDQQRKQKAKEKAVAQRRRKAAEAGKRFRSVPGQPKPRHAGRGGGGGRPNKARR